jgi:hypothetical protein
LSPFCEAVRKRTPLLVRSWSDPCSAARIFDQHADIGCVSLHGAFAAKRDMH